MNNSIAKTIFKIGARYRNPGLFAKVLELKESDSYSSDQLMSLQEKKLTRLLKFMVKHSPYYSDLLKDFNYSNALSSLKELPIIQKSDLLANIETLNCYSSIENKIKAETSGSTGQPFQFYKNLDWDTSNRASFIRSYSWYDVKPWELNGYFWGYSLNQDNQRKTKILDTLQNRFRAFSYEENELIQFLNKLKSATYLHGYSSMIYEVAKIALELGMTASDFPQLKMIKGTSEKIYNYYQDPVEKAFGNRIISEYGSAEAGIIAFECPHGHMHINEENVIVEEVDGNAIVTNLNAYSLPIIRYNTGDAIKLDLTTNCKCGRKSKIITEVLGRVGKKIQGKNNTYPSLTFYYIFKNISLEKGSNIQYQAIQKKKGEVDLKVTSALNQNELNWIKEQAQSYFKGDLDIRIMQNQTIHDKMGKLKDFITELD